MSFFFLNGSGGASKIEQIRDAPVGPDPVGSSTAGPSAAAGGAARSGAVDATAIRSVRPRAPNLRTTTSTQFAQAGNSISIKDNGDGYRNLFLNRWISLAHPPDGADQGGQSKPSGECGRRDGSGGSARNVTRSRTRSSAARSHRFDRTRKVGRRIGNRSQFVKRRTVPVAVACLRDQNFSSSQSRSRIDPPQCPCHLVMAEILFIKGGLIQELVVYLLISSSFSSILVN